MRGVGRNLSRLRRTKHAQPDANDFTLAASAVVSWEVFWRPAGGIWLLAVTSGAACGRIDFVPLADLFHVQ
jgi:hypothetical protein